MRWPSSSRAPISIRCGTPTPTATSSLDPIGTVSGSSTTLIALERSFQQDLNGDGMVGNPSIPISVESFGSTSLVQTGNDYFLYANGTSSGPALKYGGAPWTDGEWGGWTPIGAEVTATGYEVAFNLAGTNQYTVWNTDSDGNITTDTIGTVTGNSAALVALETGFHQDLNGDGIIGDPVDSLCDRDLRIDQPDPARPQFLPLCERHVQWSRTEVLRRAVDDRSMGRLDADRRGGDRDRL